MERLMEGRLRQVHDIPADAAVDMTDAMCWSVSDDDRLEGFERPRQSVAPGKPNGQSTMAVIPVVGPLVEVKL